MKLWQTDLLRLRKMFNIDNSIIEKKYFVKGKNNQYGLNPDIDEELTYNYYLKFCKHRNQTSIIDDSYEVKVVTQSDRLRNNTNQHTIKITESYSQDNIIKHCREEVLNKLGGIYPNLIFGFDSTYGTQSLENIIGQEPKTKSSSYIQPDGGLCWVLIKSKKRYILVSEQKKQGTNDKRILEGKDEQSYGNAVERLGKNLDAFDVLFGDEDIYPFVAFLQGCDFNDESSIPDRVRTLFKFQEPNQINLEWKQLQKHTFVGGSYFMRGHSIYDESGTSDWTADEMTPIMFEIANKATEYYLLKYGK
jgi:type II restriction enzyme